MSHFFCQHSDAEPREQVDEKGPPTRGLFISDKDEQELASFVTSFVIDMLIPHVEQRMEQLNKEVSFAFLSLQSVFA